MGKRGDDSSCSGLKSGDGWRGDSLYFSPLSVSAVPAAGTNTNNNNCVVCTQNLASPHPLSFVPTVWACVLSCVRSANLHRLIVCRGNRSTKLYGYYCYTERAKYFCERRKPAHTYILIISMIDCTLSTWCLVLHALVLHAVAQRHWKLFQK